MPVIVQAISVSTAGLATRVVNAFCSQNGYQDLINGSPNPETKLQFMQKTIIRDIRENFRAWEATQAAETARITASNDVDTVVIT